MENVFAKFRPHDLFAWEKLSNIEYGRGELGVEMPVLVYRLMQYTMLDVLSKAHGREKANDYFRSAGYLAGTEFAKHILDLTLDLDNFIANLQAKMLELKMGILRMEFFDSASGEIVLTVGEDLDCSGLPITIETVCCYDEGFISGVLEAYTGKQYIVREVDCWANGDRVCRFNGTLH
ncbi:MAG: 4-vinyl reductase [Clostridiales bacterium]|nr:4-vinyl reductase [Clostridiales bacterium]